MIKKLTEQLCVNRYPLKLFNLMLVSSLCNTVYAQNIVDEQNQTSLSITESISIPSLIQSAFSYHPSLRSQMRQHESSQASIEASKWQFWPTPSVGLERVSTQDPSYTGDETVTTFRLQQPLWTGGRLSGNLSKAEAKELVSRADIEISRQQLALRIIQAWNEVFVAQKKIEAYEESYQIHTRLLNLVIRRTEEGVSSQGDINLARSRLSAVESDISLSKVARDNAIDKLCLITGQSISKDQILRALQQLIDQPQEPLNNLISFAHEKNPQILKSKAQLKIAEADLKVSRASLYPEVYIRAERQYGNFTTPDLSPQNRLFIGLSTSFGAGLSSISGVETAQALYNAALEDIQVQKLTIDEQIQNDFIIGNSATQRYQNLLNAFQYSLEVSASWERQFLAGRKQWQELMNSAREQTQAQVQLVETLGSQQLSYWRLNILVHGVDNLLQFNSPMNRNTIQ